jgi:hypothetical protein
MQLKAATVLSPATVGGCDVSKSSRRVNRRNRTHTIAKLTTVSHRNRPDLRLIRGMLHDVPLEQALTWTVMEAEPSTLADISARTIATVASVADLHTITDEITLYDLQNRVCSAITIDTMNATELGDDSGAELSAALAAINSELSRVRVGAR